MLFFERDLELYISTVESGWSTANTAKLRVLAGSSIKYETQQQSVYNYKIETSPDRLEKKAFTGFTSPEFSFQTYAKPTLEASNTLPVEHLLLYSLTGDSGTQTTTTHTTSFISTHVLPELFFYIKVGTGQIYKISRAVVESAEIKIDIKEIVTISWKTKGLTLDRIDEVPDTFADYYNVGNYLKGAFANLGITLEQPLTGYSAQAFLDGTDFVNKGIDTGVSVTNYWANTITTIEGRPCYLITDTNYARITFNGAMMFTGNAQPDTGTASWTIEMAVYKTTVTGNQNSFWTLIGDNNVRGYIQGSYVYTYLFEGDELHWAKGDYQISNSLLPSGKWSHICWTGDAVTKCGYLYINGELIASSHFDKMNDTSAPTTGVNIGGGTGTTQDFNSGYIAYPEITYGDLRPKYIASYTYQGVPVDANTVLRISPTLADDSGNAHSVVGTNITDLGGYYRTGDTWSSPSSVAIGRSALWNSPEWSIEIQYYFYTTSTYGGAGDIWNDGVRRIYTNGNEIWVYINGVNILEDNNQNDYANTSILPKNTWHYICLEYHDGKYFLFIDGALISIYTKSVLVPNAIPDTGTATAMSFTPTSTNYKYFTNLRLSNIARYAPSIASFTPPDYITELNGNIPIVSGSLKLKNDLQIVSRDTLDNRNITHLDHYVKSRYTELNLTAYLRTGSISVSELFDKINANIDHYQSNNTIAAELRLGGSESGSIKVTLPKLFVQLPEIKIQDVITSNIKMYADKYQTINDDTVIEYTTTAYVPDIFIPEGKFELLLDDDYISTIYQDGAKHIYPMQEPSGTILYDIVNGNDGTITNYVNNLLYQQTGKPVGTDSNATYCMLQNNENAFAVCPVPINTYIAANGGVSLEVWWKKTSFNSTNPQIFGIGDTSTAADATVYIRGDGASSNLEICSGNSSTNTPTYTPSNGTWYHLVITSDSANSHKFYVNGVLKMTATWGIASFADEVTFLGSRDRGDTNNMIQYQSHGAVYDRILTATEILNHFNAG